MASSSSATSPEDEIVNQKSARIKQWVKNRMKELEDQNERLRLQNLRCTTQLQMLRSYTEKSRQLKEEMAMSRSITGTLPVMRDGDKRTSDDSGLTSDDTASDRRQMTHSVTESTPRCSRKPVRLRKDSSCGEKCSSTSDSSPWEEHKPIPVPRTLNNNNNNNAVERDSLNSYADDYEFDVEDEIFDEIESPSDARENNHRYHVEYVNLADFVSIKDEDDPIYSAIVKHPSPEAPELPHHKPKHWEMKLYQAAEKCLTISECLHSEGPSSASPYHVSPICTEYRDSAGSRHSSKRTASPRVISMYSGGASTPDRSRNSGDYYLPPDAFRLSGDCRTSLVPNVDPIEKCGHWSQMSDSRVKSLKRRFVVLKNNQLNFYKKNTKEEEPLMRIQICDIKSVNKINQQGNNYAFQITTATAKYHYMTESEKTTSEWVAVLSSAVRGVMLRDIASRSAPLDAAISGYLTRVRCGHSKKLYAALVGHKLMFFRTPDDNVPNGFLFLQGARICDKQRNSSDEYSGSSDEQQLDDIPPSMRRDSYSISVQVANEDPVYLVLRSAEEKEKWLYFLRAASGDASLYGTPFEILMQRMLADGGCPESELWKDLLFTTSDDSPKDTLTTIEDGDKKKALEIAKAAFLFVSVLMRPTAVQYHIDLAQNILSTCLQHGFLKNELYAQLIKLTSGTMPFGLQGWKLLALTIPLFLPQQYALLWLLKRHIARWCCRSGDEGNMADYCQSALERAVRMGPRLQGPSKLEATSILTRDPTTTKFPHSISVKLPNQQYQVVEFDGSTEIGQCLSSLCLKLGMRPALLSGYALYIDNLGPEGSQLLKGKQKVCDALSTWEQKQRDVMRGRIPADCVATLSLKMRHYWKHLVPTETPIERSFLVWRMAEEVVAGLVPMSTQLADQVVALFAQFMFGDASDILDEQHFIFVTSRCYPSKMLDIACIKSLKASIQSNWMELQGMLESEAIRVLLQVLRKWPLFGCDLYSAGMRTSNDRRVWIALSDSAVHILDQRHFDVIRTIPFQRLSSFGAFHNDFMLTVDRSEASPDEAVKERVTFSMDKSQIEILTLHLAEYIRCQKLVWKVSK